MKSLLLMRHAKSSWKDPDQPDRERPLNKRGEKDAPRMGKLIKEKDLRPERIVCSTATRASQTAELLAEKINYKDEIVYLDSLYLAEPQHYIEVLRELPDDVKRVMLIGHNPGLEGLLQMLSGKVEALPTAAVAYLLLPIKTWSELETDVDGVLVDIWRPRDV